MPVIMDTPILGFSKLSYAGDPNTSSVKLADALMRAIGRGVISPTAANAERLRQQFPKQTRFSPGTLQRFLAGEPPSQQILARIRQNLRESTRSNPETARSAEIQLRGTRARMSELTAGKDIAAFGKSPMAETGGAHYRPHTGVTSLRETPEVGRRLAYAQRMGRGDAAARLTRGQVSGGGEIRVNPRLKSQVIRPALEHEVGERFHADRALRGVGALTPFSGHYGPEATTRELLYAAQHPKSWQTSVADRVSPDASTTDQLFMRRYTSVGGTAGAPIPVDSRQSRSLARLFDQDYQRMIKNPKLIDESRLQDLRDARTYAAQGFPMSPGVEKALADVNIQRRLNRAIPRDVIESVSRQQGKL